MEDSKSLKANTDLLSPTPPSLSIYIHILKLKSRTNQIFWLYTFHSNNCNSDLEPAIHQELPSWGSKSQDYFCNDPDFQVKLNLCCCNELELIRERILDQISHFSPCLPHVTCSSVCFRKTEEKLHPKTHKNFHEATSFLGNFVRLISSQISWSLFLHIAMVQRLYHWKKAIIV